MCSILPGVLCWPTRCTQVPRRPDFADVAHGLPGGLAAAPRTRLGVLGDAAGSDVRFEAGSLPDFRGFFFISESLEMNGDTASKSLM